jgi:5-methylcytosine-specific restriction endonuclease McrA
MNYLYRFTSYWYHKIFDSQTSPSTTQATRKTSGAKSSAEPQKRSKRTIPKTIRNQVWRKWCGNTLDGKCFSCGLLLKYECWEAGHIVSEAHGGQTTIDNLRPICLACNRSMGKTNMYDFMRKYNMPGLKYT